MKKLSLDHLPQQAGIYLFKDKKGNILYIGKAKNLNKRVSQYFSPGSVWKQEMLAKADHIDFMTVKNESESLYLESNLIKQHLPPFNNMLKGANAYAYIKLTNERVPQVLITRQKINDGATYIGPKHNTRELKKFLQYLRQILQWRSCGKREFHQHKLCSYYYFWLCKGFCVDESLSAELYKKMLISFFKGESNAIKKIIKNMIDHAAQEQNFERAGKLRDIYIQIDQFSEKQSIEFAKDISGSLLMIRPAGDYWVYVVLNFYEGKLIDIIRYHSLQRERDREEIVMNFSTELGDLEEDGEWYSSKKHFWTKDQRREMNQLFDNLFESYLLSQSLQGTQIYTELLHDLQHQYQLPQLPSWIECIDISHLGGDYTSGGLSCLIDGIPDKTRYKKYKIKSSNDDYLALEEVMVKRFHLDKKEKISLDLLPKLFILDGGKGQLGVIKKVAKNYPQFLRILEHCTICSLGKGEARKKSHIGYQSKKSDHLIAEELHIWDEGKIHSYPLQYSQADRILIKARDEAHRFANYYRKQQEQLALKKSQEMIWK